MRGNVGRLLHPTPKLATVWSKAAWEKQVPQKLDESVLVHGKHCQTLQTIYEKRSSCRLTSPTVVVVQVRSYHGT